MLTHLVDQTLRVKCGLSLHDGNLQLTLSNGYLNKPSGILQKRTTFGAMLEKHRHTKTESPMRSVLLDKAKTRCKNAKAAFGDRQRNEQKLRQTKK